MDTLPYNFSNKAISETEVREMLIKYGHSGKIIDINIYRNAFVHKSYCTRKNDNYVNGNTQCPPGCLPLQEESYERLEFLGDAVVNLVVGYYLFQRYAHENEGILTKMRTKLVNGNMMAELALEGLDLGKHFIIAKQIEDNAGRSNKKILEDCFEAFIGAMYIDSKHMDEVETWIINLIEQNVDFADLIMSIENHKDLLFKQFQHTVGYVPKFYERGVETDSITGVKKYIVCIKDHNNPNVIIGVGEGATRKAAENNCAKAVCAKFGWFKA